MDEHNSTPSAQAPERDYQRVINAWAMYDWANSAFAVVILTAVFPVYYRSLVSNADGFARHSARRGPPPACGEGLRCG